MNTISTSEIASAFGDDFDGIYEVDANSWDGYEVENAMCVPGEPDSPVFIPIGVSRIAVVELPSVSPFTLPNLPDSWQRAHIGWIPGHRAWEGVFAVA